MARRMERRTSEARSKKELRDSADSLEPITRGIFEERLKKETQPGRTSFLQFSHQSPLEAQTNLYTLKLHLKIVAMKRWILSSLLSLPILALAEPEIPSIKGLFATEQLLESHKLEQADVHTYHTERNFEEIKEELKKLLGEEWRETKPPQVELPETSKEIDLGKTIIFEHSQNTKLRVSATLTTLPHAPEGKSFLLLTLMKNFQEPNKN